MDSPQRPKPRTRHLTQRPEGDVILVPEENEYQPDSSKLQLSDTFIEALIFGDGPAAAAALIELNELDGEALECLIRLLDDNQTVDVYFRGDSN